MDAYTLFILLLTAHLLGDFVLQRMTWIRDKMLRGVRSKGLIFHILVHALLVLPLFLTGDLLLWEWIFLLLTHYLIDLGKIYAMRWGREVLFFIIDQLLHLTVILFIAYGSKALIPIDLNTELLLQVSILTICIVLLTRVSGMVIAYILKPWSEQLKEEKENSLEKAGSFIGSLERVFVFFLAFFGQLSAIGFLIAAKSVFRFGDLQKSKGRKLTEYVLIGTMLSFGFALAVFLLYNFLITLTAY